MAKIALVFAFLLMCMSGSARAEWYSNAEAKLKYDSNLDNASAREDIVDDSAFAISAVGGKFYQLDDNDSLSIHSQFNGESYHRFHGMDNASLGINVMLRRKWALGLYAPWTSLSISASHMKYNDEVRDGGRYQVQLSSGKRITERWDMWAEVQLEKRTADHKLEVDPGVSGAVFDQTSKTLKLNAVYALNLRAYMAFGYQLRHGDVASTILSDKPGSTYDSVMTAVTLDPAFGPNAEVYRLTGTTHMLGTSVNMILASHFVIGLEYQYQMTYAKGNNNYFKSVPALTLAYSF